MLADLKIENVFVLPREQYLAWLVVKILLHVCFFENHDVEEKSDANMIKKLITFLSGSYKTCSFAFKLINLRSIYLVCSFH